MSIKHSVESSSSKEQLHTDKQRVIRQEPYASQSVSVAGSAWRIACYARISRDDGTQGESDSIQLQRAVVYDWARHHEASVVASYTDDGYSGATFDRPGFRQMIYDAARGLFDTIVVKDLSRFGRSYLECGSWIERRLPKLGIRLYSIADNFDSMKVRDCDTALLLPMKNLMNEMHVITTSEKVRRSLHAKWDQGKFVANFAPYGYIRDPKDKYHMAIDSDAAQVVHKIFTDFMEGRNASEIARILNASHIAPPFLHKRAIGLDYQCGYSHGNAHEKQQWHAKTILRILRDETYTGTLVQGKTQRVSWRSRMVQTRDRNDWHRRHRCHTAIVDTQTFESVQAKLNCNITLKQNAASSILVSKMYARTANSTASTEAIPHITFEIRCADCSAHMQRNRVSARGKTYLYWHCSAHRKNARTCSSHTIQEDVLAAKIAQIVSRENKMNDQARSITNHLQLGVTKTGDVILL